MQPYTFFNSSIKIYTLTLRTSPLTMKLSLKYMLAMASVLGMGITLMAPPFEAQVTLLLLCISIFLGACVSIFAKNALLYICITLFSVSLPITVLEAYYYIALNKNKNHFVHDRNFTPKAETPVTPQVSSAPVEAQTPAISVTHAEKKTPTINVQNNTLQEPLQRIRSKRLLKNDEVLYDVVYTLNAHGNRITPAHAQATKAVVFIGCSFTFGDGLQDNQTFPWRVSEKLGAQYQVFNLGISAHGTHHALSRLQEHMPHLAVYEQVYVFYTAIDDHTRRFKFGPRYEIQNNLAVRQGDYGPITYFWNNTSWEPWLKKSYLFNKIKEPLMDYLAPLSDKDQRLALMQALIATMQNDVLQKSPSRHFTVLAWPPHTFKTLAHLPKNIHVLNVENWLPHFSQEEFTPDSKYILRPGVDTHPTAYANELVSNALVNIIQERMAP